jgi:hypothetical protein
MPPAETLKYENGCKFSEIKEITETSVKSFID